VAQVEVQPPAATDAGKKLLLTFGGAYSNHIQATAAAGYYFGFSTIGVIRGEQHSPLNPILAKAADHGMTLTYVDRAQYRAKMTLHSSTTFTTSSETSI
jgi:1-aminocyclopropane-1-carboxylate deaminase